MIVDKLKSKNALLMVEIKDKEDRLQLLEDALLEK